MYNNTNCPISFLVIWYFPSIWITGETCLKKLDLKYIDFITNLVATLLPHCHCDHCPCEHCACDHCQICYPIFSISTLWTNLWFCPHKLGLHHWSPGKLPGLGHYWFVVYRSTTVSAITGHTCHTVSPASESAAPWEAMGRGASAHACLRSSHSPACERGNIAPAILPSC